MLDPHTQSIRLTWRPELRFYERRVAILQRFEEEGVLRAFRVENNFVDARLFESRDLLKVRQDGLELSLLTPDADPKRAWAAVETVLSTISPAHTRTMQAFFQHLAPVDLPFEQAIQNAYGRVLGQLGTPGIRFDDWALLVDVEMSWRLPAAGQMEFGIVRAHEVADRLSRRISRTGLEPQSAGSWLDAEFPDVSVFSDSHLASPLDPDDDLAIQAKDFWDTARTEMGRLVVALEERIGAPMTEGADNE